MLTRYFNADTGGGGGDGQTDDRQQLQGLLQRHNNDAMAVIATLLTENHELRGERRTLRQRQDELQGQLPAADALVLAGDDAAAWRQYQELGPLVDIQAALTERQTLQGELTTLRREAELQKVAEVAKYKPSVLKTLAGELAFVIKTEKTGGKDTSVVYVKDGDKEVRIDRYAEQHWADFAPALSAETARPVGTPITRTPPANTNNGQQSTPPKTRMVQF